MSCTSYKFCDLSLREFKLTDVARAIMQRYYKGYTTHKAASSGVAILVNTEVDGISDQKPMIKIKEAVNDGGSYATIGDAINYAFPKSDTMTDSTASGVAQALRARIEQGVLVANNDGYHDETIMVDLGDGIVPFLWYEPEQCYISIRKLTPKECFRLQGWADSYFEKAQFVNSDTQLYRQAGNGVTVPVIETIAKRLTDVCEA